MDQVTSFPVPPASVTQAAFPVWFLDDKQVYFFWNVADNCWQLTSGTDIEKRLQRRGISAKGENGRLSAVQMEKLRIQDECCIKAVASLGWEKEGIQIIEGKRVLVTRGCKLIKPKKGPHHIVRGVLEGMLREEQSPYFWGHFQHAAKPLYGFGEKMYGHSVILCGPTNCGKSLIQDQLITPILGGRHANPWAWLTNKTPFNAECFEAVHLNLQDENNESDYISRKKLAAAIKRIAAKNHHTLHRKNFTPYELPVYWRMTLSINDTAEALAILPALESTLLDKLLVFKCYREEMPLPTRNGELNRAFESELPAFLHWLLHEFEIPDSIKQERWGVKSYLSEDVRRNTDATTIETTLIEFMEKVWDGCMKKGNATVILTELGMMEPPAALRTLLANPPHFGIALTKIAENDKRVWHTFVHGTKTWHLNFK